MMYRAMMGIQVRFFGVLIYELLPLGSFLCGQLTEQSSACGVMLSHVPLLMQKDWLSQLGLLPSCSKQGLSPSTYPELGRNAKPRPLLAIKKKNPNKIISSTILASFQFT